MPSRAWVWLALLAGCTPFPPERAGDAGARDAPADLGTDAGAPDAPGADTPDAADALDAAVTSDAHDVQDVADAAADATGLDVQDVAADADAAEGGAASDAPDALTVADVPVAADAAADVADVPAAADVSADIGPPCRAPSTMCGTSCVDTASDAEHCGSCAVACATGMVCAGGVCGCGAGLTRCGAACVSTATSAANCGSCGHACTAGTECAAGVCDPVIEAAPGFTHGCALRASGLTLCWGDATFGQLGDGLYLARATPAPVGGLRAVQITSGAGSSCAIEADTGRVLCWGRNLDGELGTGTGTITPTPTPIVPRALDAAAFGDGRRFVEVRATSSGACARDDRGDVWCWGRNTFGEVGDGTTSRALSATRVALLSGVTAIGAGHNHVCARLSDGTLRCWGYNEFGQLGDGTTTSRTSPAAVVALTGVTQFAVGSNHTCAVTGGRLYCWGRNAEGELGLGDTASRPSPTDTTFMVDAVRAGSSLTFLRSSGAWYATGRRAERQQADGVDSGPRLAPAAVASISGAASIWLGVSALGACATTAGRLSCWGADTFGALGVRDVLVRTTGAPFSDGAASVSGITSIAPGGFHVCAVSAGALRCAGRAENGQLARSDVVATARPGVVGGLPGPVRMAGAGRLASCALVGADGARAVYCWGDARYAELGVTTNYSVAPVRITITGGEPVSLAMGSQFVCAIVDEGAGRRVPYCWGKNTYGTLGRGTFGAAEGTPAPVAGDLTDAAELSLADDHACARHAGGAVSCWGYNGDGRVGDASTTNRYVPTRVSGLTDATRIATGSAHACAARVDGSVVCWGRNESGQLHDGSTSTRSAPVIAIGVGPASAVGAGGTFSCAIVGGLVQCWGGNAYAQLGGGTRAVTSAVVGVGGVINALDVVGSRNGSSDALHACARLADGTALCWGYCASGRCGTGEELTIGAPTPVLLTY